jgi:hypothetical protein
MPSRWGAPPLVGGLYQGLPIWQRQPDVCDLKNEGPRVKVLMAAAL